MALEIERRWLLAGVRANIPVPSRTERFEQGYWETPTPSQSVRIRIIDSTQALVTVKMGTGVVREEHEYPVAVSLGYHLLDTCPHRLQKTRDTIGPWLIDRFAPPLSGIVLLERELDRIDREIVLPEWVALAREVTEILTSRDLARLATRLRKNHRNPQEALERLLAKRS